MRRRCSRSHASQAFPVLAASFHVSRLVVKAARAQDSPQSVLPVMVNAAWSASAAPAATVRRLPTTAPRNETGPLSGGVVQARLPGAGHNGCFVVCSTASCTCGAQTQPTSGQASRQLFSASGKARGAVQEAARALQTGTGEVEAAGKAGNQKRLACRSAFSASTHGAQRRVRSSGRGPLQRAQPRSV